MVILFICATTTAFVNNALENTMAKLRLGRAWAALAVLIFPLIAQAATMTPAQEPANERYRVFLLRNITPENAIQLLADVNITKVSQLSEANMLLVTDDQEALVRASSLIKLVDSQEKYDVKILMPAADFNKMPATGQLEAELAAGIPKPSAQELQPRSKIVSIGTFLNTPGNAVCKVILDTCDDSVIAVAPVSVMNKIAAIAKRVTQQNTPSAPAAEDNHPQSATNSQNEPDAIFNSLLNTLDKAEKDLPKTQKKTPAAGSQLYTGNTNSSASGETTQAGGTNVTMAKAAASATKKVEIPRKKSAGKGRTVSPEPNRPDNGLSDDQTAKDDTNDDSNALNLYEPNYVPNADESLELNLPDKLDIISLLDLVGKYLNLNYVYDDKIKNTQVNLRIQGPIKVRELYPLVESILKFTNLAMTRKGNLVTIVQMGDAMDADPMLMDGSGNRVKTGDVVVTRIFQLNYIDTANAKNLLEGMKLGAVTELQNMGTVIVTGYAYRMNRIEQLLEVVDKPGKPKQFKFRQLHYTMAKTLAPKVKGLIDQLGDISAVVATTATPAQPTRRQTGRPAARPPIVTPQPAGTTPSSKTSIYLDADERTNRILMIGTDDELGIVNNLVDALDVAQQDLRALRVYEIQHVDAEEVRNKLEALGIVGASRDNSTSASSRITSRTFHNDQGQQGMPNPAPTPTPSPQATSSDTELPTEELQVVVIESTNSLMVNATPEQHALIASIIAYVDSESIQQAIPYVVYPLQNQPPEHVAEVLDKLVKEVIHDKEGKIEKVINKTDQEVTIVPDPSTFSLIVYASKKNQDWIANLIKNLDRRRPQVLIDVTLVEVTNVDQFDLDLDMASKLPNMLSSGSGFLNVIDSNNIGKNRKEAYVAGGQGQAFYSDKHIQALLTAMESKNYGRVLAKPKILVNDGQKGSIRTTDTTNVAIQNTIVPQQGNSQITTSYQQYNAGITLEIQPNIGEGDLLLLIVRLDRTDFVAGGATNAPPNTKANTVDTIVTVPNNKTIILGGLLKLNQGKTSAKVPLLGDIPLVGGLFRSTSDSVNDSKLYVFVKANILRPEEGLPGLPELESISEKNRAAFENGEDKFQKHQDWPGIKPKPVEPVHVLDAE